MSQAKTAFVLLVVFFAGCAAERFIVPPARAGTNPQRWEYVCKEGNDDRFSNVANEMGQQGWELAAAAGAGWGSGMLTQHSLLWCFKRPLP
jgi:hypothetical protein